MNATDGAIANLSGHSTIPAHHRSNILHIDKQESHTSENGMEHHFRGLDPGGKDLTRSFQEGDPRHGDFVLAFLGPASPQARLNDGSFHGLKANVIHSSKLPWKWRGAPDKTTVLLMGVSRIGDPLWESL